MLSKKIYNSRHNSPNMKKSMIEQTNNYQGNIPSNSDINSDYQLHHMIINSQKTQRMKIYPYIQYRQSSPLLSQNSEQFEQKLNIDLNQLKNEIKLHRDAIEKANKLIQVLNQQNQQLIRKLNETQKQLYEDRILYEEKLQKANNLIQQLQGKCSRNQTAANSFIQYSKSSKTTPIRIYGRSQEGTNIYLSDGQSSALQQITKLILINNISKLQKEMNSLQDLALQEGQQISNVLQHNKYMQAYIQDEVLDIGNSKVNFTAKFGEQSNQSQEIIYELKNQKSYSQQRKQFINLLYFYRSQIEKWKSYAGNLEKQLNNCIKFMQEFISKKNTPKKNKKPYTNQDLIKFIVKDICKIFNKKLQKSAEQIKQLHSILKELFDQIKKNQWKFVNTDSVKLP